MGYNTVESRSSKEHNTTEGLSPGQEIVKNLVSRKTQCHRKSSTRSVVWKWYKEDTGKRKKTFYNYSAREQPTR